MKAYRFRLDTVLRVRRIEEGRAVAALADANRALVAADEHLNQGLDRYRRVEDPTGSLPATSFLAARARQDLVASSVVAAGTGKLRAEAHVDIRRDEWSAAATRVAALERLDERRREEHALEVSRHEILEVDDMVSGRVARRPR